MHSEKIEGYSKKNNTSLQGGGQDRIKAQHDKGKLTARERIDLLLDEGSFTEIDPLTTHHYHEYDMQKKKFYTDGVVGGYGNVDGRQVFVFAYDFTVLGGTLSQMGAKKICKLMDHAVQTGCPIIGVMDSGGARIQEGIMSLDGFADIFYHNQLASGVIPQITASIGPSAGGSVYSPAMTDFVIMVEKVGTMFVTGPDVVKTVLGEEISFDDLGGAMTHGSKSGVAHFVAQNEYECMDYIKKLISYLPQNNTEAPPKIETDDDPNRMDHNLINIIPENLIPLCSWLEPGMYPGVSTKVIIGTLNESQNRMKRAALFDESMSSAPASTIGWFATIPTTFPFSLPKPTTMFAANNSCTSKNSWLSTIEFIISFISYGCKGFSGIILIKL